jgi:hypothetical protein
MDTNRYHRLMLENGVHGKHGGVSRLLSPDMKLEPLKCDLEVFTEAMLGGQLRPWQVKFLESLSENGNKVERYTMKDEQ